MTRAVPVTGLRIRIRRGLPRVRPEKHWQQAIVDTARAFGWMVFFTHDSRHSPAGWPDLVLLRPPRLVIAEVKGRRTEVRPEQRLTLDRLAKVPCVEVFLWREGEASITEIADVLRPAA